MRKVEFWFLQSRYNAVNERVFDKIDMKGVFHEWYNDNSKGLKAIVETEIGKICLVDYDKITFINDKTINTTKD